MQAEKLAAEEAIRTGLYGVGTSDRSAVGGLLLLVKYLGLLWILVGGLEHFFPNSWNDDPIFHIFHKGLKPPTRIVWDFLGKLRVCTSVNYCFFALNLPRSRFEGPWQLLGIFSGLVLLHFEM